MFQEDNSILNFKKYISPISRILLDQKRNARVGSLDAKLSFWSCAKIMHVRESLWRREYACGSGTKPVQNLRFLNRSFYGSYDPTRAQCNADRRAAQKGPRQKLLKSVADRLWALVKEPDQHRSLFDALHVFKEQSPENWHHPTCERSTTTSRPATSA